MATWFAQNSSVNIDSVNQWNSAANGSGSWLTWASLGASDILVANGKTAIAINVNVTCGKLTTIATGGTAGGGFVVATNGVTITATIEAGTTTTVVVTVSSPNTVTFIGDALMGATASAHCIDFTGTGTVNITGTLSNTLSSSTSNNCWRNSSSGTMNIICSAMNASTVNCNGNKYIENASSGIVNYTGNVIGIGNGGGSGTAGILNSSSGTVNIVGNVTGVSSGNGDSPAIRCTGSGTVNIAGNVNGTPAIVSGSSVTAINISAGTLTVTGNLVAGAAAVNACCILCSSTTGSIIINGDVTAAAAVAIASSTPYIAIPVTVYGNLIASSNGVTPVAFPKTLIHATTAMYQTYRINTAGAAGVARSLYTGGVNLGQPVVGNVRSGTAYGVSSEYTGTLAVPSPTLVAIGVATDNTVGSYSPSVNASDIRNAVGLASANLDTQLSSINSKTTNLPSDPADQSLIEAAISSLNNLSAAQVNAELLDVLNIDTFGELSAPPAASSTLAAKLTWLFMWARNKATATSSQRKLYADDTTTVVSIETVGDDGVTFTKGEAS